MVTQFEEFAISVKAKLNKLEIVSMKSSELPSSLKMCF